MEWTEKQILDTLRFIEESDYDEVRLETGNLRLHVRKTGAPAVLPESESRTVAREAPAPRNGPAATPVDTVVQPGAAAMEIDEVTIPAGMVGIHAPMVGTFYRAPAPHLPPFVQEGASVRTDDTVCLIEVMKLFNTIKAGVSGKVVRILAQNAAAVKRDQLLMIIEPLQ
jgi:acetyl-CoA carboxylase biotin carboxyl carrier protein